MQPTERVQSIIDNLHLSCTVSPVATDADWLMWLDSFTMPRFCPLCGRVLVIKRGKYGAFVGCNGYPGCRYTEDV